MRFEWGVCSDVDLRSVPRIRPLMVIDPRPETVHLVRGDKCWWRRPCVGWLLFKRGDYSCISKDPSAHDPLRGSFGRDDMR